MDALARLIRAVAVGTPANVVVITMIFLETAKKVIHSFIFRLYFI